MANDGAISDLTVSLELRAAALLPRAVIVPSVPVSLWHREDEELARLAQLDLSEEEYELAVDAMRGRLVQRVPRHQDPDYEHLAEEREGGR